MTKKTIKAGILALTASAALLTCMYTVSAVSGYGAEAPPSASAAMEQGGGKYLVRAYNGKIAYFTGGEVVETDIDVSGLRAYDRQLLENGIAAYTYEEVLQLLEDFSS
ncbi:MAG: hypothetical protein FWC96_00045 [Oscillospiraceae bacterium]|nr:hypothetical protein [Oscillospiraceae bacterium]